MLTIALLLAPLAPVQDGAGATATQASRPASRPGVPPPGDSPRTARLERVLVEGRNLGLVGRADSASEGVVGAEWIRDRPLLRPGEVLERVPGVIVTQHSGAGKANQFFLRGFNLDHGTDFATTVAGTPVNLPTHGHGQGYTDLNFLVPELVQTVRYRKGPYDVRDGDFASAGSVRIDYVTRLEEGLGRVEGGSFGQQRAVLADSFAAGPGDLLFGVEVFHDDGPWVEPDHFDKRNGVLRYSAGDERNGWSLTAMGYDGEWNATDQIPRRALDSGLSRFGTLDATTGGESERWSLAAQWRGTEGETSTRLAAYGFWYGLDLFSNFTYFRDDPINGDQFEQTDRRTVLGFDGSRTWAGFGGDAEIENTLGAQVRSDFIRNGLHRTAARRRLSTVREDEVIETSLGVFGENRTRWGEWFRTVAGLRGDVFFVDVESDSDVNSGHRDDATLSPKLSLVFGPFGDTELYVNGGLGFHSNDARGATLRDDPTTPAPLDGSRVPLLVQSKGAELGVRTTAVSGLQSAASLWALDLESELVFVGDAGNTEASRPSRRLGIEWTNDWTPEPLPWLALDLDAALSRARFRDDAAEGDRIPGAIESVVGAGITASNECLSASLRFRYFGRRDLVEDGSVRSSATSLCDLRLGWRVRKSTELSLEAFNLFDRKASDIEYYYPSRLPGEPAGPDEGGFNDIHFHPVEPFAVRVALTTRF